MSDSIVFDKNLNFLYYALSVKNMTMKRLLQSKAFVKRFVLLKSKRITIDDMLAYKELTAMIFPTMNEMGYFDSLPSYKAFYIENYGQDAYTSMWRDYKLFKTAIKELSEVLFEDRDHWLSDFRELYGKEFVQPVSQNQTIDIPSESSDLIYLADVCSGISPKVIEIICSDKDIVKALRKHGKVASIDELLEVVKIIFYKSARLGLKYNVDTRKIYFNRRRVVMDLCKEIYGDEQWWHDDYESWAKENEEL